MEAEKRKEAEGVVVVDLRKAVAVVPVLQVTEEVVLPEVSEVEQDPGEDTEPNNNVEVVAMEVNNEEEEAEAAEDMEAVKKLGLKLSTKKSFYLI